MDNPHAQTLYSLSIELSKRKAAKAKRTIEEKTQDLKDAYTSVQDSSRKSSQRQYPTQEKFFGSKVKYIIEDHPAQENVDYIVSSTNQVTTKASPEITTAKTAHSTTKRKRITKEHIAKAKTQGRI